MFGDVVHLSTEGDWVQFNLTLANNICSKWMMSLIQNLPMDFVQTIGKYNEEALRLHQKAVIDELSQMHPNYDFVCLEGVFVARPLEIPQAAEDIEVKQGTN